MADSPGKDITSLTVSHVMLEPSLVQDRIRAAVLGFAIGDALGFPYRGLPPQALARQPFLGEDFAARPRGGFGKGQFSDDTQMLLAVADAVATEGRVDGRSAAQHLSWLWQEGTILQPPAATTRAMESVLAGTPWMGAGAPLGVVDPSCLSRGVVVGVFPGSSLPQLAHHAQVVTVVTHKDPLCAAAVAAVARAVQLAVTAELSGPAVFCQEVAAAAAHAHEGLAEEIAHLHRVLSWDRDRALHALRQVGVTSEVDPSSGLPGHVTPVLLTGLYGAMLAPLDFRTAVSAVLRSGGEVDVAAGIAGAIVGARIGAEALPPRLRRNVMYGEALVDTADRLFDVQVQAVAVPVAAPARAQ